MNKTDGLSATTPSQEQISERSSKLWEGYGRPPGRDKEIWLEAERQLLGVDPLVEGSGGISVSAAQFDETTRQKKPVTRLSKPELITKPKPALARTVPAAPSAPARKTVKPADPVGQKTVSKKKPPVKKR